MMFSFEPRFSFYKIACPISFGMQSLVVFSHGSIPKSCWFKVFSILKQRPFPFSRHEIEGKPLDQGYVAYLLNHLHTYFFSNNILHKHNQ